MAETTIRKNATGFGYKYTDIAEIHEYLETQGIRYYQFIEPIEGNDYIYTVPIIDGKEQAPRRGCRVITASLSGKTNPAQEQGSGITYARRYSLLMAFGLATTDDDAACMTVEKVKGEVVDKPKRSIPGYPSNKIMLEIVNKHYPEGHADRDKICEMYKVKDIAELPIEALCKIYDKFGGR